MPGLLVHAVKPILRLVSLAACAVVAGLVQPIAAAAHAGGAPLIHVPAGHIEPGQPFELIAADLGQNATVTLELAATDRKVLLGTVTAGPDGHFQATLTVPAPFPDGYAELTATSDDGSLASEWVLVGAGPDLNVPQSETRESLLVDPSLILLPVGAVVLFLVWRFWSRGSRGGTASRRPR